MAKPAIFQKVGDGLNKAKVRNRAAMDRAYLSRLPFAKAKLAQIRNDYPQATPADVQELLNEELIAAEVELGVASVKYSTFASMYVLTSAELRELDIKNEAAHQKFMDLIVVLDGKVFRFIRRAAPWVLMFAAPFLKGAKPVQAALKTPVAKKLQGKAMKKVVKAARPVAKNLINQMQTQPIVSGKIIEYTNNKLGPVPVKFTSEDVAPKTLKAWFKRFKR